VEDGVGGEGDGGERHQKGGEAEGGKVEDGVGGEGDGGGGRHRQ